MSEIRSVASLGEFPGPGYVILHIGRGPTKTQDPDGPRLIVRAGERFYLRDDIWIEMLDEPTANNVQRACEPPHYKIDKEVIDRHLYAFVMQALHHRQTRYDALDTLRAVISLSRLVNPTSTGDRYCAQIMHYGTSDSAILAVEYFGASPDITLGPNCRDWLSHKDGETLLNLMPWAAKSQLTHERLHRAFWNHERAMRTSYIDIRWPIVITGLEALLNIGKKDPKSQFCKGARKLAECLKISVTEEELNNAYDMRSKLVHAENFLFGLGAILPRPEHSPLYEKLEGLLRTAVRTALLDENFGDLFMDDAAVRANWHP